MTTFCRITCNIMPTPASGGCTTVGEMPFTDAFELALVGVDAPEVRPTWIVRVTFKTIRLRMGPRSTTSEICEPSGPAMSDVTSRTLLPVVSIPLIACSTSFSSTPAASAAPFRSRRSTYTSSSSLLQTIVGENVIRLSHNKINDSGLIHSCLCVCTCVDMYVGGVYTSACFCGMRSCDRTSSTSFQRPPVLVNHVQV